MHMNQTRQREIAEAEAEVARLTAAQMNSEMSDSRYYTNGSKARDDHAIIAARAKLEELKKDQS